MACADCKHYGKGWRDDIGRCRWDPAEGWPLVYASEDYPVVNEWDGEGCPQFKERNDGEVIAITSPALPSGLDSGRGFVFENGGSAPMASEDVLEWAETSVGLLFDANCSEREALFIQNTIDRLAAEVRELRKGREILVKIHAAWTYPPTAGSASIGALLDEAAEHIEPGVFGAALGGDGGLGDGE